ncbi:hypothetical protein WDU94_004579 [Cyamophila willieti]
MRGMRRRRRRRRRRRKRRRGGGRGGGRGRGAGGIGGGREGGAGGRERGRGRGAGGIGGGREGGGGRERGRGRGAGGIGGRRGGGAGGEALGRELGGGAGGGNGLNVVDGESLYITKVSRLHMGAYLCIASNGVPPSISKRVMLKVQFPPMLSIPNQLEGAYVGQDVSLECHTEAYPASINYWTTEKGDMIVSDLLVSGEKYEAVSVDDGYRKYMMLKIRNVAKSDFGNYQCVAKNSLGETDGLIKLDEIPAPEVPNEIYSTTEHPILKKKYASIGNQISNSGLGEFKDTGSYNQNGSYGSSAEFSPSSSVPIHYYQLLYIITVCCYLVVR